MNNTDYSSIIKDMAKYIVTYAGRKDCSDKTFTAMVTEIIHSKKVKVLYCGNNYTVHTSIPCNKGDYVRVCAPCNNWNDLFVAVNKTS